MTRTSTSTVTDGLLHCMNGKWTIQIPADAYTMTGSDWYGWLKTNSKFRFKHGADVSYTAYKHSDSYWKVQRRVNGRLRNKYLGSSGELHYGRLLDIGHQLALPDELYWQKETGQTTGSQELRELNYKISGANELIEQYLTAHGKDAIPGSPRWEHLGRFRQWLEIQGSDTPGESE
ncbi:hypothetical protein BJP36_35475 (plasmid) [Moorena producens JHB]|uniref:Uncharacterized protein n=1 Tax=Moorena producens (strain JHB) TaxID=1454205 RepID=A0A1D9GBW8_MOOP1|nr:hypothetical protein [Moorena producens]AOY85051.2 hypothetical protein BJP36_35420 [Moorena producens JHB]AOY85060.2 hypothetical protein BJP36_35475 [Moorena producens JHB]